MAAAPYPLVVYDKKKIKESQLVARQNTPMVFKELYDGISKLGDDMKARIISGLFKTTKQPHHNIIRLLYEDLGNLEDSELLEKMMMHSLRLAGKMVVMTVTSIIVDIINDNPDNGLSESVANKLIGYNHFFEEYICENYEEIHTLADIFSNEMPNYNLYFQYPEGLEGKSLCSMTVETLDICIEINNLENLFHEYLIRNKIRRSFKEHRKAFLETQLPLFRN